MRFYLAIFMIDHIFAFLHHFYTTFLFPEDTPIYCVLFNKEENTY